MAHRHRLLTIAAVIIGLAAALALIVAGGGTSLAEDGIIYVDADAPGPTHDGSTWDYAYTNLQDALDAAAVVAPVQIWVAAGTYKPSVEHGGSGDRYRSFQMANDVAIYGGFAGTETELGQRNWALHETILSGDIGIEGNPDDNSYHVFYHPDGTGLDSTAILDGFTIAGGNADGSYPHNFGGGMYNYASSPTLANCTFTGNYAYWGGGGMLNSSSSPTLTNCTFSGNSAGEYGGGMLNDDSSPTLTNCTFTGNSANSGGGMDNYYSSPALTNCTFSGNSATWGWGGGMYNNYYSSPALTNCTFSGNSANYSGGGMYNYGSSPALTNCTFTGNSATYGGGMYNYSSSPILTNCTFSGNSAALSGGIYNYASSPTLTNCILWGDGGEEIYNWDTGSMPAVTYSNIQGGYGGEGNINADPLFLDAAGGDLRLSLTSPAIDAGNNSAVPAAVTTDLGGNPRFADVPSVPDTGNGHPPIVDMGAYEAPPDVIFVDRDATGPGDGTSWLNAFTGLQDGLDAAVAPAQIWVAAGVYTPTVKYGGDEERNQSFQMVNGVVLYGGFDPSVGDDAWAERDWVDNLTILSGDLNGDDEPEFANNGENSYHVFYHPPGTNLDSTAVLDGFTISGGNANSISNPHRRGGGIRNESSSPTLTNCTFTGNSATVDGGGIYNSNSSPVVTDCTFSGNSAEWGAGMYNRDSAPVVTDCTFSGNSAEEGGGGVLSGGSSSSPVFTNCTFSGNHTDGVGGAMLNGVGGSSVVTNCTFSGNQATTGGGMHNEGSTVQVTNCILWGDDSPEISNESSTLDVTYSDVQGGDTYSGTGNINEDPLFADPDNGDFHLGPGSPCIDAGTNDAPFLPEYDFEGDPRIIDGGGDGEPVVDMGVDEVPIRVYLPLVLKAY